MKGEDYQRPSPNIFPDRHNPYCTGPQGQQDFICDRSTGKRGEGSILDNQDRQDDSRGDNKDKVQEI
jgi:hypothetical protein